MPKKSFVKQRLKYLKNISIFSYDLISLNGNEAAIILINVLRGTKIRVLLIVRVIKANNNRVLDVKASSATDVSFGTITVYCE